jgi:hypothetical protein
MLLLNFVDALRHACGIADGQSLEPRMNPYHPAYVPVMAHMQDLQREAGAARLTSLDRGQVRWRGV